MEGLPLGNFRIQVNAPQVNAPDQATMKSSSLRLTSSETTEATGYESLKSGSAHGQLTETSPEISVDVSTETPYRIQNTLMNGDFSLGTAYWEIEGQGGYGWRPRWFDNEEGDPCNQDPEADDNMNCGAIVATEEGAKVTMIS